MNNITSNNEIPEDIRESEGKKSFQNAIGNDTRINLVVNRSADDAYTLDLGHVFYNMKVTKRLYAWILILCMLVGLCIPLIMYQINKDPLKVFSVVTLTYKLEKQNKDQNTEDDTYSVTDLTAPDGEELDLNQITSAYVLQNALNGLELSQPITLSNLRSNIRIQRILTDESYRQQEILNSMVENKSSTVYEQMASMEYKYRNSFVVSLENGFGDEDDKVKVELKNDELKLLLNQILISYNEYLVKTYADQKLPDDAISVINMEELDIPECVDLFRQALNDLYTYCEDKVYNIRSYRSFRTGYSLNDLMENIRTILEVDIEYLSSYVYVHGIAKDRDEVIDNYKYNLLVAKNDLAKIEEDIASVDMLLNNYKNDEILVSSPDSENMQTAVTNTTYYNNLLLTQSENEELAAQKEQEIQEIETRITAMVNARGVVTAEQTNAAQEELEKLAEICTRINTQVREHMEEIFASSFYNTMIEHSAALGETKNFLAASYKKMIIGVVAGAVIGIAIWFIAGLAPEFSRKRRDTEEQEPGTEDKEVQA